MFYRFGRVSLMGGYKTPSASLHDLTVSRGPYHWWGVSLGKLFVGACWSTIDPPYQEVLDDFTRGGLPEGWADEGEVEVLDDGLIVFPSLASLEVAVDKHGEDTVRRINGGGRLAYKIYDEGEEVTRMWRGDSHPR